MLTLQLLQSEVQVVPLARLEVSTQAPEGEVQRPPGHQSGSTAKVRTVVRLRTVDGATRHAARLRLHCCCDMLLVAALGVFAPFGFVFFNLAILPRAAAPPRRVENSTTAVPLYRIRPRCFVFTRCHTGVSTQYYQSEYYSDVVQRIRKANPVSLQYTF